MIGHDARGLRPKRASKMPFISSMFSPATARFYPPRLRLVHASRSQKYHVRTNRTGGSGGGVDDPDVCAFGSRLFLF